MEWNPILFFLTKEIIHFYGWNYSIFSHWLEVNTGLWTEFHIQFYYSLFQERFLLLLRPGWTLSCHPADSSSHRLRLKKMHKLAKPVPCSFHPDIQEGHGGSFQSLASVTTNNALLWTSICMHVSLKFDGFYLITEYIQEVQVDQIETYVLIFKISVHWWLFIFWHMTIYEAEMQFHAFTWGWWKNFL